MQKASCEGGDKSTPDNGTSNCKPSPSLTRSGTCFIPFGSYIPSVAFALPQVVPSNEGILFPNQATEM